MNSDIEYFVYVDKKTNKVTSLSTSRYDDNNCLELKIKESELEDRFKNYPFFYIYDGENFVYDDSLRKEVLNRRLNTLSNEQVLGQKNSDLEIRLLRLEAFVKGDTIPLIAIKDDLIKDWKSRYQKKWCTKGHLSELRQIGLFTDKDISEILGAKI